MNGKEIKRLLEMVQGGELSVDDASLSFRKHLDFSDVKPDTDRRDRLGFDEVIYGRAKSVGQIKDIAEKYLENSLNFICTGLDSDKMNQLKESFPDFYCNETAGFMKNIVQPAMEKKGTVAIVTAGTSDMKIAEETREILEVYGATPYVYADIGVAGIHRFFSVKEDIAKADVIIVIAGMEGALPSITGGLFSAPVIAVPASTGYGTALSGFTALFAMLSSCANGITVVNIDNGFGAAMAAMRIINLLYR